MFGRKGTAPPQGPRNDLDAILAPGGKIDQAMQDAIRLFTDTLAAAGRDAGALGLPGPFPGNVAAQIADCITYDGEAGPEYITLGVTRDFKAFSYQQHCWLFIIVNTVGIAETLPKREDRARFAAPQCAEPLFHAHVMRRWVRHVLPVGAALGAGDMEALTGCLKAVQEDIAAVIRDTPGWIRQELDLAKLATEWTEGFPATIGRPLDGSVQRMNGIPMPDFVAGVLTDWLARVQARGLTERHAAG